MVCRTNLIKYLLSVIMPIECIAFCGFHVVDGDQSPIIYHYDSQLSNVVFFRLLTVTRAL